MQFTNDLCVQLITTFKWNERLASQRYRLLTLLSWMIVKDWSDLLRHPSLECIKFLEFFQLIYNAVPVIGTSKLYGTPALGGFNIRHLHVFGITIP